MFRIADLPHSPGVVYYHLLWRRETRISGVAPFSFRIGIWYLFVHRGQKSYTATAFGKLWTTQGVRCILHRYETGPGIEPWTFGLADECSTTELTLLLLFLSLLNGIWRCRDGPQGSCRPRPQFIHSISGVRVLDIHYRSAILKFQSFLLVWIVLNSVG